MFIEARSKDANERSEVGHWETDSMLCKYRDGVNVLTERMSRKVIITKLDAKDAAATTSAITERLQHEIVASITADNGPENAEHEKIASALKALFFSATRTTHGKKERSRTATASFAGTFRDQPTFQRGRKPSLTTLPTTSTILPMKCLDFQTPNEIYSQCCIQS